MADLSKVKIGESTYNLKDADSRSKLATLLGEHAVAALGEAAWLDMDDTVTAGGANPVTGAGVKQYVDDAVAAIKQFNVHVCEAEAAKIPAGAIYKDGATVITGTMAASADTEGTIYLVKNSDAGAGAYIEWLTFKNGANYYWENIGSTTVDLTQYLKTADAENWKVAGIKFGDDHEVTDEEVAEALGLQALAYKESAEGTVEGQTISGVKASGTSTGEIAVVLDQNDTAAVISTKADYTPAGTITINALTQTATDIESTGDYTPAGTVVAKENGDFQALKSAVFAKNSNGVAIEGTNAASAVTITPTKESFVQSLKAGNVNAASFTEGEFTPASISDGFFSAGSQASYSHSGFSGGSLGDETKEKFAKKVLKPAVGSGADAETLLFSYVDYTDSTVAAHFADAVTAQGEFTAAVYGTDTFTPNTLPSIDTDKFDGGSKAADTFSAEKLPVVDATEEAWIGYSSAEAAAQVFTGEKYQNATTADTALKEVKFTGSAATIVVEGQYDKATANGGSFSGTKSEQLIPTAITYKQASVNAAGTKFTGKAIELDVGDIVVADKDVTVS